jgi:hypothetical protein
VDLENLELSQTSSSLDASDYCENFYDFFSNTFDENECGAFIEPLITSNSIVRFIISMGTTSELDQRHQLIIKA